MQPHVTTLYRNVSHEWSCNLDGHAESCNTSSEKRERFDGSFWVSIEAV